MGMSGNKSKKTYVYWNDVIKEYPSQPKGYSSIIDIAKKTGRPRTTVADVLARNNIDFILAYDINGKLVKHYKDGEK